jgi:hypothetical protein
MPPANPAAIFEPCFLTIFLTLLRIALRVFRLTIFMETSAFKHI